MSKTYLQEKITGTNGQVVMINSFGNAEAQTLEAAPEIFTISKTGLSAGTNTVTFPTGKERTSTDYIVIPVLRDYVNYEGQIFIQTKNTTGFTFYSTANHAAQTVDFVIIGGA